MRIMKEKHIPAVPTFTIFETFANEAVGAEREHERQQLDYKIKEFKKQVAAGVPFAVGSDVGPFPHGTQARELTLMVQYGMKPLAVLQADMINGAKLLRWEGKIGELKAELSSSSELSSTTAIEAELGDILFTAVNLARHLKVDPESALRATNAKFRRRFAAMESAAGGTDALTASTPSQLDLLWNQAKNAANEPTGS